MNDVGAFSLFCISHGGAILVAAVLVAVAGVYGARRFGIPGMARRESEMLGPTVFNALFLLIAATFLYQAMDITSLHTALEELNAPHYEQGASAVATPAELAALQNLSNRGFALALAAFALFLLGCGLQYLSVRRARHSGPVAD